MAGQQMQILLDVNVWLDFFVPGRMGSGTVARLVRTAIGANVQMLYPAHILEDLFFEIRRDAAEWVRASAGEVSREAARYCHEYAWGCVTDLHELASAVPTDDADIWLALKYRSLSEDLEDNLVLAAAQRVAVDYLVTTDRVLLNKATVAALAPQDMLTVLEAKL